MVACMSQARSIPAEMINEFLIGAVFTFLLKTSGSRLWWFESTYIALFLWIWHIFTSYFQLSSYRQILAGYQ